VVESAKYASLEEEPQEKAPRPKLELKALPEGPKYEFLDEEHRNRAIINADLSSDQLDRLLEELRLHRRAIGYSVDDIKGLSPALCMHHINLDESAKPLAQPQRKLNQMLKEVVKKEVIKLRDAGIIYPIKDSNWVSLIHVVPKKGGMTVVKGEKGDELVVRTVSSWRMCIDY